MEFVEPEVRPTLPVLFVSKTVLSLHPHLMSCWVPLVSLYGEDAKSGDNRHLPGQRFGLYPLQSNTQMFLPCLYLVPVNIFFELLQ